MISLEVAAPPQSSALLFCICLPAHFYLPLLRPPIPFHHTPRCSLILKNLNVHQIESVFVSQLNQGIFPISPCSPETPKAIAHKIFNSQITPQAHWTPASKLPTLFAGPESLPIGQLVFQDQSEIPNSVPPTLEDRLHSQSEKHTVTTVFDRDWYSAVS